MHPQSSKEFVPSILMVDDVPANLKLLAGILENHGYKVRPVSSGALALRAIQKSPPDLILLDIAMPGMDGYSVCRQIKSDEALSMIPVIFLSALDETAIKVEAFRSGGVDYITKPYQPEEVLARVESQLKLRQLQLSLAKRNRELAEVNRRLQESERMRDDIVHMIVHDMRSPLTAQMGFLELVWGKVSSLLDEAEKGCLSASMQISGKLAGMVNSLLDASRLEAGEMPMNRVFNDIEKIAQDALELFRPFMEQRQVSVTASEKIGTTECDAYLVQRIFENLIGNALRFTQADGSIRIVLARDTNGGLRIEVIDNGIGIAPENHALIFRKFGQAGSGSQKNSSGIGLAFCKLAVEAHGGQIGVESEPGKGSTFWFTLPKHDGWI